MDKLIYKPIEKSHVQLVSDMVWEVFLEFEAPDYSDEGTATFKAFIDPERLVKEIEAGDYKVYCCFEGDTPVGAIAIRQYKHISLLFVKSSHHRRGIAKKLLEFAVWDIISKHSDAKELTVNSSPYAVEIYKRLGFTPTERMQERDGIIFMPMKKLL